MGKDTSNSADKSGSPTSLLISIVLTIVVFAMAEIRNTFSLDDGFVMRYVLMAFVLLGLALAFFWKRLERSPFLKISSGFFFVGLWTSLFMTTLAPVLLKGESTIAQGHLMQQFGFGFVIFSAFMLVVALLQNQKMVPGVILSSLGALGLMLTGGAGFLVKPSHSDEGLISSHTAKGHGEAGEGEEISSAHHGDEHSKMSAKALPGDGEDHGETPGDSHGEAHGDGQVEKDSHDLDETGDVSDGDDHHEVKVIKSPAPLKTVKDKEKLKEVAKKKPVTASLDHAVHHEPEIKKAETSKSNHKTKHSKEKAHGSDWSYDMGSSGPQHWGDVSDEYRKCSVGQQQSPIDVPSAWPAMSDVKLDYTLTSLSIVDNGRTIQFNVGKQNFAYIGGKKYELVQFHMHTPSEHWIDGRSSPMEIHFVHKDEKNNLAVLGVMVEQGEESKLFSDMWGFVPQNLNLPASPRGKTFKIASLIPANTKVYRYRGSLTTPPCSENVLWSVASERITMSKEQIDAFRVRYKNNARPIQKRSLSAH